MFYNSMFIIYFKKKHNIFLTLQNNLRNRISLWKVKSVPDLIQPVSSFHLPKHHIIYLLRTFETFINLLEDSGEHIGDDCKRNHDGH